MLCVTLKRPWPLLAASRENNIVGQERIIGKLNSALEYQLQKGTAKSQRLIRLPSVSLSHDMQYMKNAQNGEKSHYPVAASYVLVMQVENGMLGMQRVNILVNDQPRPPTAQEQQQMQQLRYCGKRLPITCGCLATAWGAMLPEWLCQPLQMNCSILLTLF